MKIKTPTIFGPEWLSCPVMVTTILHYITYCPVYIARNQLKSSKSSIKVENCQDNTHHKLDDWIKRCKIFSLRAETLETDHKSQCRTEEYSPN